MDQRSILMSLEKEKQTFLRSKNVYASIIRATPVRGRYPHE